MCSVYRSSTDKGRALLPAEDSFHAFRSQRSRGRYPSIPCSSQRLFHAFRLQSSAVVRQLATGSFHAFRSQTTERDMLDTCTNSQQVVSMRSVHSEPQGARVNPARNRLFPCVPFTDLGHSARTPSCRLAVDFSMRSVYIAPRARLTWPPLTATFPCVLSTARPLARLRSQ